MDRTYRMNGGERRNTYSLLKAKTQGDRSLGTPQLYNSEMDLGEI
jgi:hypothetical protein